MTDYNCFDPAANVGGIIANPKWRTWLCNWNGKFPSSFSGTWNVYGTPDDVCPAMPRTPTAITFSRWKEGPVWNPDHNAYDPIPDLSDCDPANGGIGYSQLPDYTPNSGERTVAFGVFIENPLVPFDAPLSLQARAVRASATHQVGMGQDVVFAASCSANSFYMLALFGTGECLFRVEITGVAF